MAQNITLTRNVTTYVKHNVTLTGNVRTLNAKCNKTLQSAHFGVVAVELINCKCGGIVRNEIW